MKTTKREFHTVLREMSDSLKPRLEPSWQHVEHFVRKASERTNVLKNELEIEGQLTALDVFDFEPELWDFARQHMVEAAFDALEDVVCDMDVERKRVLTKKLGLGKRPRNHTIAESVRSDIVTQSHLENAALTYLMAKSSQLYV